MYEKLDEPTPDPLPETLADLTQEQMFQLVDAYAVGNVITMRIQTLFPRAICRIAYERFTNLKNLVLGWIRDNPETTKNAMLTYLTGEELGMPNAVGSYAVDAQQAAGCTSGDWEDFVAAVLATAPAAEV